MEEDDGCKHTHHVTQAHHRIGHAERKVLDDIHPQDGTCSVAEATADKLPIGEKPHEILPCKREVARFGQAVFHQHLPSGEEHALQD